MKGGTANDSIHAITTDSNNNFLITGDTTGWVSVGGIFVEILLFSVLIEIMFGLAPMC